MLWNNQDTSEEVFFIFCLFLTCGMEVHSFHDGWSHAFESKTYLPSLLVAVGLYGLCLFLNFNKWTVFAVVERLHTDVMEFIFLVLYFSFFLCLCALVCLYFSGCQEMTYKHEGKKLLMSTSDCITRKCILDLFHHVWLDPFKWDI